MIQLSRTNWLEEGLHQLTQVGVDALTIDFMCKIMWVTKGSFYHHFDNRQVFLEALLHYWEDKYTTQFIAVSQVGATPQEQLELLSKQVIETYSTSENAIRAWAQTSPLARQYQERVDQRRIQFLFELHLQIIGDEAHARTMAHLAYTTLIGATQILPALSQADLAQMYQALAQLSYPKEK